MTWDAGVPDATKTAKDNRPGFTGNWDYIESRQQRDHFYDEDANNDGHHKKVEMQNLTDAIGAGNVDVRGDPNALSTNMTTYFYGRPKTATESPDAQNVEAFYAMNDGANNIVNQLGFRAMLNFQVAAGAIVKNGVNDWNYQHNIATVVRNNTGLYTVTFTVELPTDKYIVIGTTRAAGVSTIDSNGNIFVISLLKSDGTVGTYSDVVKTTGFTFQTRRGTTSADPEAVMLTVIGG